MTTQSQAVYNLARLAARSAVGLAGALVAVGLCACDAPETEPPPPGEQQILVGSAEFDGTGFVAVEDGVIVEMIPGAQGGFHVWLNLSVRGAAGNLLVEREARRVSDGQLVYRGLAQRLVVPDEALDAWWDSPTAAPAFMCPSPIGVKVFDEALEFEIRLLDEDEQVLATDSVTMIPICPEGELAAFCRQICAG